SPMSPLFTSHQSRVTSHFAHISILVSDVPRRILVNRLKVLSRRRPPHLPRVPHHQRPGRHLHALRHQRPRCDDASRANLHIIQNHRPHPNQAPRLNRASVQRHRVPHGHAVSQNQWVQVLHHVQHRAVLNIRPRADADVVHVAANDGARPHARVLTDHHISDDYSGFVYVGRGGDLREFASVPANRHGGGATEFEPRARWRICGVQPTAPSLRARRCKTPSPRQTPRQMPPPASRYRRRSLSPDQFRFPPETAPRTSAPSAAPRRGRTRQSCPCSAGTKNSSCSRPRPGSPRSPAETSRWLCARPPAPPATASSPPPPPTPPRSGSAKAGYLPCPAAGPRSGNRVGPRSRSAGTA